MLRCNCREFFTRRDTWIHQQKNWAWAAENELSMTLNELRYIVVLSSELNFGRAAARCFVTQPALSAGLKKLEEELGVVIFDRGGGRVSVTPVGWLVINHAKLVLDSLNNLKDMVVAAKPKILQTIRILCVETVAYALLSSWIPLLRERIADFSFEISEEPVHDLHGNSVLLGDADIAIACYLPKDRPAGFVSLYLEPFSILMRAGHPLAVNESVRLENIKNWKIVTLNNRYCLHRHLHELFGSLGFTSYFIEVNNLPNVVNKVITSDGISLLPTTVARKMAKQESYLKEVPLAEEEFHLMIGMFCNAKIRKHKWFKEIVGAMKERYPDGSISIAGNSGESSFF